MTADFAGTKRSYSHLTMKMLGLRNTKLISPYLNFSDDVRLQFMQAHADNGNSLSRCR
jgi:hypothetical protein